MAPEPSITAASETQASVEVTTTSHDVTADSTCNDNNNGETSDPEKSLDFAVELLEKGSTALKENDFSEAVDCFSRALEIRSGFSFHCLILVLISRTLHLTSQISALSMVFSSFGLRAFYGGVLLIKNVVNLGRNLQIECVNFMCQVSKFSTLIERTCCL